MKAQVESKWKIILQEGLLDGIFLGPSSLIVKMLTKPWPKKLFYTVLLILTCLWNESEESGTSWSRQGFKSTHPGSLPNPFVLWRKRHKRYYSFIAFYNYQHAGKPSQNLIFFI